MTEPQQEDQLLKSILSDFKPARSDAKAGKLERARDAQDRMDDIKADDAELTVKLKGVLAVSAFIAVGAQLAIADYLFFRYGSANHWDVATEVIVTWLSATVVEVLGVVVIIARHLFPSAGSTGS